MLRYFWTAVGVGLLVWALADPSSLGVQLGTLYHFFIYKAAFG